MTGVLNSGVLNSVLLRRAIMLATSAGIGLFLAFIGLQATQGLGLAVYSPTTVVTLGTPCLYVFGLR